MRKVKSTKNYVFIDLFEKFIRDSKSGKRVQKNGAKISKGTIENYNNTLLLIKKFCDITSFEIRIVSVRYLNDRQMIREKNYWIKFYKKFADYLYNVKGHFDNYVGHVFKIIKAFFTYLNQTLVLNIGDFYKNFYIIKEDIPVITLMPGELNFLIYNKDFEESLRGQLKRVKDFFVFGCTVALRYSDLINLKQSNIRIVGDKWFLQVKSKKTSIFTSICLPNYAVEILKKYINSKSGYLLPKFKLTNLNLHIKEVIKAAGFNHNVSKSRNKRGVAKSIRNKYKSGKEFQFFDLVSSHTMRRTAITTMLTLGVPEHVVRKISGHSHNSREFYKYVSIAQSYQDKETTVFFEKLSMIEG